MKDLLMNVYATESDQEKIKLKVKSIMGFGLGMAMTALGPLLLLCTWVLKVCRECGGDGCWLCDNHGYHQMYGKAAISPWVGVFIFVVGIIAFGVVNNFKNKHNIPDVTESNSSVVGTIVAVGLILGFIEIFVCSDSFKNAYNGLWSFLVGKMAYVSAFLAAYLWIFVLILPISTTAGKIVGSIEWAEKDVERKRNSENKITSLYRKVYSTVDCSGDEQCKRLEKYVETAKCDAIKKYRRGNNITMTAESYSELGLCGVSNTHFHYNLDEESDYVAIDMAVEIKSKGYPLQAKKIQLDHIKYYKIEGSMQYSSNVEGGGVNMGGAIAGAIIAGGAAAIIGSQVGTETRTTIVEHDERKIILFYEKNGKIEALNVETEDFEKTINAFRKLIPEKEESMVQMAAQKQPITAQLSSADELKKFKELLDCGAISQEEYDAKKKQILGL